MTLTSTINSIFADRNINCNPDNWETKYSGWINFIQPLQNDYLLQNRIYEKISQDLDNLLVDQTIHTKSKDDNYTTNESNQTNTRELEDYSDINESINKNGRTSNTSSTFVNDTNDTTNERSVSDDNSDKTQWVPNQFTKDTNNTKNKSDTSISASQEYRDEGTNRTSNSLRQTGNTKTTQSTTNKENMNYIITQSNKLSKILELAQYRSAKILDEILRSFEWWLLERII